MRQQLGCIGWVCAVALLWGAAAHAEPSPLPLTTQAASPLAQMCAAAELVAEVEPMPERMVRREIIQNTVRAELRSMVRSEVQRDLRPGRAGAAPGAAHADSSAAENRGSVATAGEAAAQAQQARRNQDVAAARAKGLDRVPLTGGSSGTAPRPPFR